MEYKPINKHKKILCYQQKAVEKTISFLEKGDKDKFLLQAPTGSGKTFILASIIDKYIENFELSLNKTTFIFIAPSTGKLDHQGYEKITSYLKNDWVKGFETNYIGLVDSKSKTQYLSNINYFKPNNVYFIGWNLISKNTKIMNIDSEKNDLFKVIFNTKDQKINIVLIIDEAHREFSGELSADSRKQLIEILDPYKTICVSATLDNPDFVISVHEVRDEAAIKKEIEINSGTTEMPKDLEVGDEIEILVKSALDKQKTIKKEYFKKNISNQPLILIQIPNNKFAANFTDDYYKKRVEDIIEKMGYKKDLNYAVWLDKEKPKISKLEITSLNSSIEILIFKQAIAIGWDIPRANILIRLREAKSPKFNIQTLGRILRNPFFKFYDSPLIDNAFVYTFDKNYINLIKKESFIFDSKNIKKANRSDRGKNIDFIINKIKFDVSLDNDNTNSLVNYIVEELFKNDKFTINFFEYQHEISNNNLKFDSTKFVDTNNELSDQLQNNSSQYNNFSQQSFRFYSEKNTLLNLFIKYKTISSISHLHSLVFDRISESKKINEINKKIKEFYYSIIYNYNKDIFENPIKKDVYSLTIIEYIFFLIDKFQEENFQVVTEEFELPIQYEFNDDNFIDEWDKVNVYDFSLNNDLLSSNNEKEFYKSIMSRFADNSNDNINISLFRNGVGSQDYYLEYFNEISTISKFYPDFLLINHNKKILMIIEVKGYKDKNIDKEINNKLKSFNDNLSKIKNTKFSEYKVLFYFATFDSKNGKLKFINKTEYDFPYIINVINDYTN